MAAELKGFRFELLLFIAGIIGFIALFSPWARGGKVVILGMKGWQGNMLFVGSWLMVIAALIKYGVFNSETLESMNPWTDTVLGSAGAIVGIIGGVSFLYGIPSPYVPGFGLYLAFIGGALGLFSAIAIYWSEMEEGARGMDGRNRSSSSGGL
ncbi:hypothetical protein AKJ50_00895 [candidate division MSBL1 archaeon SCGC-AAA382A13]|uniref:Uncharacterized protein n=1 Tax=candidate division MSBL1 archaeon SCGC-AAA382A13 TaxID=1698279 RepID=A0A133VG87_9EURY|nr:hypothetical protein AKJ50_00895 [candidate division MSBL1 archaeon SCGC-AAA382A13]